MIVKFRKKTNNRQSIHIKRSCVFNKEIEDEINQNNVNSVAEEESDENEPLFNPAANLDDFPEMKFKNDDPFEELADSMMFNEEIDDIHTST